MAEIRKLLEKLAIVSSSIRIVFGGLRGSTALITNSVVLVGIIAYSYGYTGRTSRELMKKSTVVVLFASFNSTIVLGSSTITCNVYAPDSKSRMF